MSISILHKFSGTSSSSSSYERAQLKNVAIHYMYRDASNYKSHETVVFENPRGVSAPELWVRINEALHGVMLFNEQPIFKPELVGLPTAFLFDKPGFRRNEDDHDWHELLSVEETDETITYAPAQPIEKFIESLSAAHTRLT